MKPWKTHGKTPVAATRSSRTRKAWTRRALLGQVRDADSLPQPSRGHQGHETVHERQDATVLTPSPPTPAVCWPPWSPEGRCASLRDGPPAHPSLDLRQPAVSGLWGAGRGVDAIDVRRRPTAANSARPPHGGDEIEGRGGDVICAADGRAIERNGGQARQAGSGPLPPTARPHLSAAESPVGDVLAAPVRSWMRVG